MFSLLQRYQKTFLVFATVFLTVSFGLGTIIFAYFDQLTDDLAGKITDYKVSYTRTQFNNSYYDWNNLNTLALKLSRQAVLTQEETPDMQKNFQSGMQDYWKYVFGTEKPILSQKTPLWDAIFSLTYKVADIENKRGAEGQNNFIEKYIADQLVQQALQFGKIYSFNIDPEKIRETVYYLHIPKETKEELKKSLSKSEVWNRLILLEEAKKAGVRVTDEEVDRFVEQTRKLTKSVLSGEDSYSRLLRSANFNEGSFRFAAKEALTIIKFFNAEYSGLQVSLDKVYQEYKLGDNEYQVQYLSFSGDNYLNSLDYTKERLAFFDEKTQAAPDYFKVPASVDFEFMYAAKSDKEDATAVDLADEGGEKLLQDIHSKVTVAKSVKWSSIAAQYDLQYGKHSSVSEDDISDMAQFDSASVKDALYKNLKEGEVSKVIADGGDGHLFVRLLKRTASRTLSREEVANSDEIFLKRYYESNKSKFDLPERYHLGYVVVDYETIEKNLLPTSNKLKTFYEEYKDKLYRTADSTTEEPKYKTFEEVKSDVESRFIRLLRIDELRKIGVVYGNCVKIGEEANLKLVVEGLAKKIMGAPEALRYLETNGLQSVDAITADNPTGDENFVPSMPQGESKYSTVARSPKGMYFYRVIKHEDSQKRSFNECRDDVKQDFLKSRAMLKASNAAKTVKQEFGKLYAKATDEQKQGDFAIRLFQAVAAKNQLVCQQTKWFKKASEVPALATSTKVDEILDKLLYNNVSDPVEEAELNSVLLLQITNRKTPTLADAPSHEILNIQRRLWNKKCREYLKDRLDHKQLAARVNLVKDIAGMDEIEDF